MRLGGHPQRWIRSHDIGVTFLHRDLSCRGRGSRALQELMGLEAEGGRGSKAPLVPFKVLPAQPVPAHIPKPSWWHGKPAPHHIPTEIHDAKGIEGMRAAGRLAAEVLAHAGALVAPGVTTEEIDAAVHTATVAAGAYPSPLHYGTPPFPKSVCTSVNECVCHGIPNQRPLEDGDIVNIDVTVWLGGYHGDTSRTFLVGDVSPAARELVETTRGALHAGIAVCKPGVAFREVGKAIDAFVRPTRFNVSEHFIGHGIGQSFHTLPNVLSHRNSAREGVMRAGQTFTIEPILHDGRTGFTCWDDGWTIVSKDGSWTAQFEHTLLVTEGGVDILTQY